MKNIYIGLICLAFSLFICFFSAKEGYNALGYKSPQLNTHKKIWFWTNRCFGILTIIGSALYLLISILALLVLKNEAFLWTLNKLGLIYIVIAFVITEVYAFTKNIQDKKIR